eukprot:gene20235-14792_t
MSLIRDEENLDDTFDSPVVGPSSSSTRRTTAMTLTRPNGKSTPQYANLDTFVTLDDVDDDAHHPSSFSPATTTRYQPQSTARSPSPPRHGSTFYLRSMPPLPLAMSRDDDEDQRRFGLNIRTVLSAFLLFLGGLVMVITGAVYFWTTRFHDGVSIFVVGLV